MTFLAVTLALLAEEPGFDGFGVGERHERPFISSSPTVVLGHVAALTRRIRLFTAVTTLGLLDPVRAYAPVLRREIPDPPFVWGPVLAAPPLTQESVHV